MKNRLLAILFMVLLSSCNNAEPVQEISSTHKDMPAREAQQKGYVVTGPSGPANIDKMERFYADYQNEIAGRLTLAHYTDEGDPVYVDLEYDGNNIVYVYDNTWDQFGGKQTGVSETTCSKLEKRVGVRGDTDAAEYYLTSCKEDIGYSDPGKKEYSVLFVKDDKQ